MNPRAHPWPPSGRPGMEWPANLKPAEPNPRSQSQETAVPDNRSHLGRARSIFGLGQTITLYDLTNTYFEGVAAGVSKAKRGHSKDGFANICSDCPLVTLAMALDSSGFVRRVQFFAANSNTSASEPTTLKGMLTGLDAAPGATVVMDAGIATEANLKWLREQGYHYVVVSKLRQRQFDPSLATEVQSAGDVTIKLQRVQDAQGHVLLYCHSPTREEKDRAIDTAKASGLEAALVKLQAGLSKPRGSQDVATICSAWAAPSSASRAPRNTTRSR